MSADRLQNVRARLQDFAAERERAQFHTPKNLAMAIVSEAGELAAALRWVEGSESDHFVRVSPGREKVAQEVADVAIALLLFCDRAGIELLDAVERKIALNAERYPAEEARGRAERPPTAPASLNAGVTKTRNVLLMLSNSQPPPPEDEVAMLAERSSAGQPVAFVTTRIVRDLVAGECVVAFYGDASLGNALLGYGIFDRSVPIDTPEGAAVIRDDPLYGATGVPASAKSLLLLRDVRVACTDEKLESLSGVIEATGRVLTLDSLPKSAARIQVYYMTDRSLGIEVMNAKGPAAS